MSGDRAPSPISTPAADSSPAPAIAPAGETNLRARIAAINDLAEFNRWAGFEVISAVPGEVELAMPWRPEAGQYSGFLHAGVIGALIDTACGFAAATMVGRVMASHFAVDCLAPAVGRRFIAHGKVLRAGRKQVFTRADLYADAGDGTLHKLVATGSALLVPAG